MKPRIAVVTTRIQPTQRFLMRDLLGLAGCSTLYVLIPPIALEATPGRSRETRLRHPVPRPPRGPRGASWARQLSRFSAASMDMIILHRHRPATLGAVLMLMPSVALQARRMARLDVTHVHGYWANHASSAARAAAHLLGKPYTMGVHAYDLLEEPRALEKKVRDAARVVACSERARQRLVEIVGELPEGHVVVCRHGIDLGRYPFVERSAPATGRALDVLTVARVVPKKGLESLIGAVRRLGSERREVNCTICGPPRSSRYRRSLRRLAATCSPGVRFEFVPWLRSRDLVGRMQRCDVYVQPSVPDPRTGDVDGIPNALVEAAAVGAPIVATHVGGIPEFLRHGWEALLVKPHDEAALASAIAEIARDAKSARDRARRARCAVEREHDLQKQGARLAHALTGDSGPAG